MRLQVEPTPIFCQVNGARVRVWNGITDDGVQCFLFTTCVAVRANDDAGALAAELIEQKVPEGFEQLRGMV